MTGTVLAALSAYTPLDLVLVFFAAIIVPAQSALSVRTLARTPRSELHMVRCYWLVIARAVMLSALVLFDWHWAGRPLSTLGLDIPIGLWGRAGFAVDAAIVLYAAYSLLLRKPSAERVASMRQRLDEMRIVPQTRAEFLLFPVMAIVASPFEELLFRGFLIWFFAGFAGLWGAVLVTSLLFGLGHAYQGWFGILRTGLIGLAFGIAYALTHSLWWLMAAHAIFNIFGGLFAWRLARLSPQPAQ